MTAARYSIQKPVTDLLRVGDRCFGFSNRKIFNCQFSIVNSEGNCGKKVRKCMKISIDKREMLLYNNRAKQSRHIMCSPCRLHSRKVNIFPDDYFRVLLCECRCFYVCALFILFCSILIKEFNIYD